MRHRQRTQNALSAVAYVFLLFGLIALIEMIAHAVGGAIHFKFGVLGIAIFLGLRRHSRAWRLCALLFIWYGIITLSFTLFVCLQGGSSAAPMLFGHHLRIPAAWLSIPLVMALMVTFWQYRILTHPAIRRLFDEATRLSTAPPAETVPVAEPGQS